MYYNINILSIHSTGSLRFVTTVIVTLLQARAPQQYSLYVIQCICNVVSLIYIFALPLFAAMYACVTDTGADVSAIGGRCHVLCHAPKKDYLRRLLQEPLPIESHLDHALAEHLNAEVVTKTVESKQVLLLLLCYIV
jgi:hypothetical protein